MAYNQVICRNPDLCVECNECVEECPMECFGTTIDKDDFSECGSCGTCLEVCQVGAIDTEE